MEKYLITYCLVIIFNNYRNTICYMVTKGMLLVGHGSTMPYNKELIESTGKLIAAQTSEFVVRCGFMNINKPSIRDALVEFKKENIDVHWPCRYR